VKQALGIFSAASAGRERELVEAIDMNEAVRIMLGSVKLGVGGKALQRQTAEAKKEKKAAAADRARQAPGSKGKA